VGCQKSCGEQNGSHTCGKVWHENESDMWGKGLRMFGEATVCGANQHMPMNLCELLYGVARCDKNQTGLIENLTGRTGGTTS